MKFIKHMASEGVIAYEAQQEIAPGKYAVSRVTESELRPGSVESASQPNEGIEITEEDFMDAYFRVVHAAMEGDFINE